MKIAVIGGGASGLMAAGTAAKKGNVVHLFEANEKVGKKLYITGKGRCNVTNYSSPNEVLENVVTNSKFLYSCLYSLTSYDVELLNTRSGIPYRDESFTSSASEILKRREFEQSNSNLISHTAFLKKHSK